MPANTSPIFPLTPKTAWATITAANTAKDGTGTVDTICTAGANGAYVTKVRAQSMGSNVASVLRLFLNNGSTNATATNNALIAELALPATTLTEVAAQTSQDLTLELIIPATYKINAVIGTAVAAGWKVTALSQDY